MKITATNIEAQLGNHEITLRISDNNDKAVGRLEVGRAKLRWWKAGTSANKTVEDVGRWAEGLLGRS